MVVLSDRAMTMIQVAHCPWQPGMYEQEELILEYAGHSREGRIHQDPLDAPAWLEDGRQAVAAINAEEQRRLEMQRAVGDGR